MASMTRLLTSIPSFLTWRSLGRTICSGRRLGFASNAPDPPRSANVLDIFREEFEIGSRLVTLETGEMANLANGSVVYRVDQTVLHSAATSCTGDGSRDFLPLTVDYQENLFAQGMIPSTFTKREGAPKERELLCGRLIDRSIRPLFPAGFYHEVQVMAHVLSSDGDQDPDVMAVNATSAALMLSDIPWGGPIGVIRIGRIFGKFIVNPTMDELNLSDLNLVYACTRDKTLMIDVHAREISEKDLKAGLRLAHPEAVKYLDPQLRLTAKAGKQKKEYKLFMISDNTLQKVHSLAEAPIKAVFTNPEYGKSKRGEALDKITQNVKQALEEECDEESLRVLPKVVDKVRKEVIRKRIIAEGLRVDGRRLDEVRPLICKAGTLPKPHGSALFSRGVTQVLCAVTLGTPNDAQCMDSLVGPPKKRFMLHYDFPPYSINEVGKHGGLNRREVGHGALAEKALLAVLPPEDEYAYVVRVNSKVMASDGSTSMATVCGGSMAMMDAGIPLRKHAAGVSVGLVSEVDPSTGEIKDYRILTDILGLEDHLGDMDFKIAGTKNGITAIQLDIKLVGIPLDIICESLEHARKGRLQILADMEREINAPRNQDRISQQLVTLKCSNDDIRRLIGPLGAGKKKIEEETGARISVGDGILYINAKNSSVMKKVLEKVDSRIGSKIEVGGVYKGVVTSIKEFGAFVEFNGGQNGLLHISELSHEPVSRVSDVVFVGQHLSLKCIEQDVLGNVKLSLKTILPKPASMSNNVLEEIIPPREEPNVCTIVGDVSSGQEDDTSDELIASKFEDSGVDPYMSSDSAPSVLIRSAAECDELEESLVKSKSVRSTSKPKNASKLRGNSKTPPLQDDLLGSLFSYSGSLSSSKKPKAKTEEVINSTETEKVSAASLIQGLRSSVKSSSGASKLGGKSKKVLPIDELNFLFFDTVLDTSTKKGKRSKTPLLTEVKLSINKSKDSQVETPVTARSLKVGVKVEAKVYQVRAHGLVLDLGNGIHGMYRFKENGRTDFAVGDELVVECSSFTSKGIPVVSLVDEK